MTAAILDGRVAIVTGAAGGIGAAYAGHLASLGATVVVADLDGEGADAVAKELAANGHRAWGAEVDISIPEQAAEVARQAVERAGSIDVLVNNAAVYRGFKRSLAEDIDQREWDRMMEVNVGGTFNMCRAVIPQMRHQRKGKIVNQSSGAALMCRGMSLHYTLSKAAILPMTKVLARELADCGVTVNAIAPGIIDTPATLDTFSEAERAAVVPTIPMKRLGQVEDLLGALQFLCTDASAYVTGQTIVIDGGIVTL
jgi:NAD(P)-dependent dehydrogenase (short-subunit alcohol dehydrogenase family)